MKFFSYGNYIIRILTFCSLKKSPIFLAHVYIFYDKKLFIFTYYNVKIHPLPLNHPNILKHSFLRKMKKQFVRGESVDL